MVRNCKFDTYLSPKTSVDIATRTSGHNWPSLPSGQGFEPNSGPSSSDDKERHNWGCRHPNIINPFSPSDLVKRVHIYQADSPLPTFAVAPPTVPTTKPPQILGELHQVLDGSATAPVPPESPQVNPHIIHGFDSRGVSSSPPAEPESPQVNPRIGHGFDSRGVSSSTSAKSQVTSVPPRRYDPGILVLPQ